MRGLSTVLLGAIGVMALWGFFAITSVLGYFSSPSAMTATARSSDVHGVMLAVTDRVLQSELKQGVEPMFESYALARVGVAVKAAVPEAWFYQGIETMLGDVVQILTGQGGPARPVDLTKLRGDLRDGLLAIGREVRANCASLTRSPACQETANREELLRLYERAVDEATRGIPDEIDSGRLASDADIDWLEPDSHIMQRARQAQRWSSLARWGCLGVAVLVLAFLAGLHHASLSRLLTVLGTVIALGAGGYLLGSWLAGSMVEDLVDTSLIEQHLAFNDRSRAAAPIVGAGAAELARHAVRDALGGANAAVLILLAAAGGSVVGGWVLRRRPPARSR